MSRARRSTCGSRHFGSPPDFSQLAVYLKPGDGKLRVLALTALRNVATAGLRAVAAIAAPDQDDAEEPKEALGRRPVDVPRRGDVARTALQLAPAVVAAAPQPSVPALVLKAPPPFAAEVRGTLVARPHGGRAAADDAVLAQRGPVAAVARAFEQPVARAASIGEEAVANSVAQGVSADGRLVAQQVDPHPALRRQRPARAEVGPAIPTTMWASPGPQGLQLEPAISEKVTRTRPEV